MVLDFLIIKRNEEFSIYKKPLKKSGILQTCHSALDAESYIYNNLEIPACAEMTFLMIFSKVS